MGRLQNAVEGASHPAEYGRKVPVADNVMIERWFRSLKTEEIYLNEYPNPRALRKAISVYIQQYNTVRPHQALGYKTPESVYQSCFASQATDLDSLVLAG